MAAKHRRRRKKGGRAGFWTAVVAVSLAAAFCILVTISEQLEKPFLRRYYEKGGKTYE